MRCKHQAGVQCTLCPSSLRFTLGAHVSDEPPLPKVLVKLHGHADVRNITSFGIGCTEPPSVVIEAAFRCFPFSGLPHPVNDCFRRLNNAVNICSSHYVYISN